MKTSIFTLHTLNRWLGDYTAESPSEAVKMCADDQGVDVADLPVDEMTATAGGREWTFLREEWREVKPGTYQPV